MSPLLIIPGLQKLQELRLSDPSEMMSSLDMFARLFRCLPSDFAIP